MAPQIARACIVGNYQELYDKVNPNPQFGLIREAKDSKDPHYFRYQESKVAEANKNGTEWASEPHGWKEWQVYTKDDVFKAKNDLLEQFIDGSAVGGISEWRRECANANFDTLELHISRIWSPQEPGGDESGLEARIEQMLANDDRVELGFEYGEEAERVRELDRHPEQAI